jgi:nucleoside-diphosphate-sugar epimerase
MDAARRVLVLGATGRTGGRVAAQLLDRGVAVRAIVRSADRLQAEVVGHPLLEVVEADLHTMPTGDLVDRLRGCDAVISCLGHTISVRGVLGPPHDLVRHAVQQVRAAIEANPPPAPVRLILMGSVSVNQPKREDGRRGPGQRAFLRGLRLVLPPSRDNQRAADFLALEVGPSDPHLQWVVVRPDTLEDGDVGEYVVHEAIVSSLFRPDHTRMAHVAHFMCELVTDDATWQRWRSRMPVVVDAEPAEQEVSLSTRTGSAS